MPDGDEKQVMSNPTVTQAAVATSSPATPAPTAHGSNNTGANKARDGVDEKDSATTSSGPITAPLVEEALTNTFAAITNWDASLFLTTVNNIVGLLQRYAQSLKLTSSMFNNVGYQSFMNNYGMYFGNYLISAIGGVGVFDVAYTTVDPSGPGNVSISYTQAGLDLNVAVSTNNMIAVSQNLRIQTVPVNGTALYQAMTDSRNVVSGGLTGSFSSIFYRIFANIYSQVPMMGCEHSPQVANTHVVLANPPVMTFANTYYPLNYVGGDLPVINAMVCTWNEFTGARFGNLLFNNPVFGPNNYAWGNSTAIVPVTLDMLNGQRGAILAAWTLAHLEYPWRAVNYASTLVTDANYVIPEWGGVSVPAISLSRCRGPTNNVLYVISGINTTANQLNNITLTVGTGGPAV
jgi:hypothetical protein